MKFGAYLASHAQRTPDKEAVVCGETRWSFAELESRTNVLAAALQAAGLEVGDRVALVLPSNEMFVEAFLAVVKAGGLAVTINTRLAEPEVRYILDDCMPRFVFVAKESIDKVASAAVVRFGVDCLPLGGFTRESLLMGAPTLPKPLAADVDECMICYTSGTTGFPKGAVLTQSNYVLTNGFFNAVQLGMTRDERQLVMVSMAHRAGFARLANMILHGSTLVIVSKFDAEEVAELISRERISVMGIVPTVGRMLLDSIERGPERFASLRIMTVTGEAFPVEVQRRLSAALPALRMYSFFGQTEAGVITLLEPHELETHPSSVGRVNPGVEVRVVGADGQKVPAGEVGEIQVRSGEPGRFLTMKRYFNRVEATAEVFDGAWLRTGDLGRFDKDHYLYLVDRKKDMVLSGGYNVYSKEVELVLRGFAGVEDAAVFGVPDVVYGEAVVAVIEAKEPSAFNLDALMAYCKTQMAGYKKPKYVYVLAELPRNSNGKVLKTELRELYSTG